MKDVTLAKAELERRYDPQEFADLLPELPPRETTCKHRDVHDDGLPADIEAIVEGCAWLRHCRDDQATLPEPEWYAMLGIVGRCRSADADGRQLAHQWSEDYPGYSVDETDKKLNQSLRASGPRTCRYIAEELGAQDRHCSKCPHRRKIKSPIVLGRSSGRVIVMVGNDEKRMNDEALAALATHSEIFTRGTVLAHVVREPDPSSRLLRPPAAPRTVPIQEATLREMLSEVVDFRRKGGKSKQANPPQQCYRALLHRGSWPGLRPLEGVTECPLLRPDGSILQEPGYDEATGLLYIPNTLYSEIPATPTSAQVQAALEGLKEAVCDFPFRNEVHRAAWLASVLTPLARHAFPGPAPCNTIDSNLRGVGKGLLANITSLISSGRAIAISPYSLSAEEQRKAILGIAIEGVPLVLIDNVAGVFGSPVLDAAFTATEWRDRLLGLNKMVTAPLVTVWYATGNNLVLAGDTLRRCLHIRLESQDEHPEDRTDFRHKDLLAWTEENRGRLTAAGLTLLRAFFVAGRPNQHLKPWGSFEGWSDLIRNGVVWLGLDDPGATRLQLRASADSQETVLGNLVAGLEEILQPRPGRCATAREILADLGVCDGEVYTRLREALTELVARPGAADLPTAQQLGAVLRAHRGRVVGGRAIDHAQGQRTGEGVLWCVRSICGGPTCDVNAVDDGPQPPVERSVAGQGGKKKSTGGGEAALTASTSADGGHQRWRI